MASIPRKIHYIWFGKGEKTDLMKRCIASWRKFMPEYEIIEWNEDNYIPQTDYEKEAMNAQKYAFVSDVARLKIVYEHGGIYLDTDVEVIKSLEPLVKESGYIGFERDYTVATGLGFAAPPGDVAVKKMLDAYGDIHFVIDGAMDQTACPIRNTHELQKLGLVPNNTKQKIGDIIVYPKDYFCPLDYDSGILSIKNNTYTIHHYGYSWADEESRKVLELKRKVFQFFPTFCAQFVFNIVNKILRWGRKHG